MQITGLHATCGSAAAEIQAKGFAVADTRARYGSGAYFWAYSTDRRLAARVAKAWYDQKFHSREYDGYTDRRFALLELTLTIADDEFLDLDSVPGKELLNEAFRRLQAIEERKHPRDQELPLKPHRVYEAAIGAAVLALRKRTPSVTLKVVKVNVSPPNGFVLPFEGWLQASVGAYILLPEAMGELTLGGTAPTLKIV